MSIGHRVLKFTGDRFYHWNKYVLNSKLPVKHCFLNCHCTSIFSAASFIYKLIDITLISRGSSYGIEAPKKDN
jgi:hypothetical protein